MEVRSEPTPVSSREPFSVGLQKSPPVRSVTPQAAVPNMRMTFSSDGSSIYKQVSATSPPHFQGSGGGCGGGPIASLGITASDGTVQPARPHPGLRVHSKEQPLKRKRGRPRKYGPDGSMSLALVPVTTSSSHAPLHAHAPTPPPLQASSSAPPQAPTPAHTAGSAAPVPTTPAPPPASSAPVQPPAPAAPAHTPAPTPAPVSGVFSPSGTGFPVSPSPSDGAPSVTIMKKPRGRLPGSVTVKKQQMAGPARFNPHVVTVRTGEDVSSKIMSFLQQGSQAVCILSANGAISNVTLRQAATSGGTVTYEGRFEILSLSGSYFLSEISGQRSRTGGLSISLAGPDGRVLGGGVAGVLTAASPVQLVLGSFNADERKEQRETDSSPVIRFSQGNLGSSSSPSHGTLSESSGGPGNPFNQTTITYNNGTSQGMQGVQWK